MDLAIELAAVVLTFVSVALSITENIWTWPTGIASVLVYAVVFYHSRLYANMLLQFVYVGFSIYGWYEWLYGGENKSELRVSKTPLRTMALGVIIAVVALIAFGYFSQRYTNASLPFADNALTSFSLLAQYLMTKKHLENWHFWIAVDVGYIAMFLYEHLYLSAVLYAAFIALCIAGLLEWRKSIPVTAES